MQTHFDLDQPILQISSITGTAHWTIRDSVEGVQIFGGIGSGKTSGSATLIYKFLQAGYGGLVLTAKPDEKSSWQKYCRLTGRESDLIVLGPGSGNYFNFLEYESRSGDGQISITENIVEVLKTVLQASNERSSGKQDDSFWEGALEQLLYNAIDLCKIAFEKVSVKNLFDIIQTIPKPSDDGLVANDDGKPKAFQIAFEKASQNVRDKINEWFEALSPDQQDELSGSEAFEPAFLEDISEARLLRDVDQFFYDNFIPLSSKTRSIIDFSVTGFLFRLLRDPIYSLFCKYPSTITPESCLDGKIILVDLPVKIYNKAGRDAQILMKYIWQRAMEKRDVNLNGRPLFLWADEAQSFLHSHDAEFQATARSSRISTVYISQNLPNYYASMGGDRSEFRVKSFLGTLSTKIFHANADVETNKYASELIGDGFYEEQGDSLTYSQQFSKTKSTSLKLDRLVRPEEFARLKKGGPKNNFRTEAYMHFQGDVLQNGQSHLKMAFNQNYNPANNNLNNQQQ